MVSKKAKPQYPAILHPGHILREDYIGATDGLTVSALANAIGVPVTRLHEIVHERRSITADTAVRLGTYFNTNAEQWMAWQAAHDIAHAKIALAG